MINKMVHLRSYAKINLYLDIGKKLTNGYHLIDTILQTINLFDEITIKKLDDPIIQLECNNVEVPTGKDSIVYQAAETLMKGKNRGLAISIHKNIPIASGLGGGSSNIATILMGICKLFRLEIDSTQLMELAAHFGMDVPFFIRRGTVYAQGRGEILLPLIPIEPPVHLVLINPGTKISTKWAYQFFDQDLKEDHRKPSLDIQHFISRSNPIHLQEIKQIMYNRFELIISQKFPIIFEIKKQLNELGALATTLSGSGLTVYGIFENKYKADEVYHKLKDQYFFVFNTSTIKAGSVFLENIFEI